MTKDAFFTATEIDAVTANTAQGRTGVFGFLI
jgi:hypothetical protein